jgi:hypothetical protein
MIFFCECIFEKGSEEESMRTRNYFCPLLKSWHIFTVDKQFALFCFSLFLIFCSRVLSLLINMQYFLFIPH